MNYKLGCVCKETVVAYFNILPHHLCGRAEKSDEKLLRSPKPNPELPNYETGTTSEHHRNITHDDTRNIVLFYLFVVYLMTLLVSLITLSHFSSYAFIHEAEPLVSEPTSIRTNLEYRKIKNIGTSENTKLIELFYFLAVKTNSCKTRSYVLMDLSLWGVKDVTRLPVAPRRRGAEQMRSFLVYV
jgi:hypothetical protein